MYNKLFLLVPGRPQYLEAHLTFAPPPDAMVTEDLVSNHQLMLHYKDLRFERVILPPPPQPFTQ